MFTPTILLVSHCCQAQLRQNIPIPPSWNLATASHDFLSVLASQPPSSQKWSKIICPQFCKYISSLITSLHIFLQFSSCSYASLIFPMTFLRWDLMFLPRCGEADLGGEGVTGLEWLELGVIRWEDPRILLDLSSLHLTALKMLEEQKRIDVHQVAEHNRICR